MMHIYSCDAIKDDFLALYKKDFLITGGCQMETFLGMEVEQTEKLIKFLHDHYHDVKAVVKEYSNYIKKALQPNRRCIYLQILLL